MKKFYFLATLFMCGAAVTNAEGPAKISSYYNPPEFIEEEWNYLGKGTVEPGFADCFGREPNGTIEWQETLPTHVWEKKTTPGDYYIMYITDSIDGFVTDYENPPEDAKDWIVPMPFYVHAQNKEKVWAEPICYISPMIFAWYQNVPELMGMTAPDKYYAKMGEDNVIRFPENCFRLCTLPNGELVSNTDGTFALGIPVGAGVAEIDAENAPAAFYDLNGLRVDNPVKGIYVKKQGSKVTKVLMQ
ncbi:MAG: hypothetical protein K2K81_03185 [Muribaculaceae bacterium]|nr:hypothetical protein [Muribaculaceae bacterium]